MKMIYENPIKSVIFTWVIAGSIEGIARAVRGEPLFVVEYESKTTNGKKTSKKKTSRSKK